jgi:hypothetical protein
VSLTDHFRRLDSNGFPDEAFLVELARLLRARLRRAEMWDQPPAYLGYPEYADWRVAFSEGDAVAAPTLDCYFEAIAKRYASLRNQLQLKENINGLIALNVDRFILARQKKDDPIGYSVFKNLQAALHAMIDNGEIHTDQPSQPKLSNSSLLSFTIGATPASREQLENAFSTSPEWDNALPRQAKKGNGAQQLLRTCLLALPAAGVSAFSLGALAAVLKQKVRDSHALRNRPPDSEVIPKDGPDHAVSELIRIVWPTPRYKEEEEESWAKLQRCVQNAIERTGQPRTADGLRRLFKELTELAQSDAEIPSWAELARSLGVRHTTLWDHLQRLKQLVRNCLETP